jgi:uncharacterized protein YciI
MDKKKYFAAKLLSPRPTFPMDMTDDERRIMDEHSRFWKVLLSNGQAVVTGPVLDPKGTYGFGVIVASSIEDAFSLLKDDPAREISEYEICEMIATVGS